MKKIFRFTLAVTLSFAMIFSSLIFASAASTTVTDESGLLAALSNGATEIQINGTVTLSADLTITTPVTISGGTINGQVIVNGTTAIFKDIAITNSGGALTAKGKSHVVLDGAALTSSSSEAIYTQYNSSSTDVFSGVIDIIGGTTIERTASGNVINDGAGTTGVINFVDCTVSGNGGDTFKLQGGTIINIGGAEGKTVTMNVTDDGFYVAGTSSAKINIYDGTTITSTSLGCNMNASGTPVLNIYGGSITTTGNLFYTQQTANINIIGGTFSTNGNVFYTKNASNATKVFVTGGNFSCSGTPFNVTGASVDIVGGSYNFDPSSYVSTNYAATSSGGTYTINTSLPAATVVNTSDEFIAAINADAPYIKLGASFTLNATATIDFDTYIDGNGYQITGGSQILINGAAPTVTLKNFKYTRGSDALKISGTPNLIISGGEIACTNTGTGNEGAVYIADTFGGTINITDDAVIKSSNWGIYTSSNTSQANGVINLIDCTVQKTSTSGQKHLINIRSNMTINVGGGAAGQEAVITSGIGQLLITSSNKATLNILPGAVIRSTGSDWAVLIDTGSSVNVTGGTIDGSKGVALVVNDGSAKVNISGGTITSNTSDRVIDKRNGVLTVSGGTYSNTGAGAIFMTTYKDSPNGAFVVNGEDITVTSDSTFAQIDGGYITSFNDLVLEQDSTIIKVGETGGDITLNNCQLTGPTGVITSASTAKIKLENGTIITGTDGEPITGTGTVEKDATSSFEGIATPLSGLEVLIKEAIDNGTYLVEVNEDFTDVPVITITDDLTFTGTGSITFAGAGFNIVGADVTLSGVTMSLAADDSDSNYLVCVDDNGTKGGSLTINSGNYTGFLKLAKGASSTVRNTFTINGGTFTQDKYYLINVNNSYSDFVVNDGTFVGNGESALFRIADSLNTVKILGGTFTQTGSSVLLEIRNTAELTVGNADGTGPSMTQNGTHCLMAIGSKIDNASGKYNFNGGTFTKNGGTGYLFDFNYSISPQFNINGGTWKITHNASLIRVNDGGIKDLRINGGTFETTGTTEPIIQKNNGTLTVTGGTFKSSGTCAMIQTGKGSNYNDGELIIDGTNNPDAIVIENKGTGAFIQYRSQANVQIKNVNLERTGTYQGVILSVTSDALGKVIMNNASMTADYTVVEMPVDCAEVRLELTGGSVIKSNLHFAFINGVEGTNYTLENKGDSEGYDRVIQLSPDSIYPKMVRLTNGYNQNHITKNFTHQAQLSTGTTYQFDIDYREFGGAGGLDIEICLNDTTNGYNNGANTLESFGAIVKEVHEEGLHYSVRFTVPTDAGISTGKNNFRIRIGQKHNYVTVGENDVRVTNYASTLYFANVTLKKVENNVVTGSNLLTNGDFSYSTPGNVPSADAASRFYGWSVSSVGNYNAVDLMAIPEGFFATKELTDVTDKAILLEGGERHEIQFHTNLKENTNYELTYFYRTIGDAPVFKMGTSGVTATETKTDIVKVDGKMYYAKTFKISASDFYSKTATSTLSSRVRFTWRFGQKSYGSKFYIANVKLYELDANGKRIGTNIIGDLNAVYDDSVYSADVMPVDVGANDDDAQSDSRAMARYLAHGWIFDFNQPEDTNLSQYVSVVKVPENFFEYKGNSNSVREVLLGRRAANIIDGSNIDDVYCDGRMNVVDLFIAKSESLGYFGADARIEALKNEILNAENTTPADASKVYYVSYSEGNNSNLGTSENAPLKDLATAISKASSGWTILLKRGDEWRAPTGTNGQVWQLKSGITIGSYGTGAKPVLNSSVINYGASTSTWASQGNNVWKASVAGGKKGNNVPGTVYFYTNANDTEPALIGTIYKDGAAFDSKADLTQEGDVWRDYDDSYNGFWWGTGTRNDVYVYCVGNPASKYAKIEIGETRDVIYGESVSNVTIDNITLKHAGGHGINIKNGTNITISNCEIGYVGGSPTNTALGNGIQFGEEGSNLTATHNYIYQCYDAGISPQNWNNTGTYTFRNVKITDNLLTNNFYNIELWSNNNNILEAEISGNIMKDAGYCWSWEQRPDGGNNYMFASHIYGGKSTTDINPNMSLTIKDNIFDSARAATVCWYSGTTATAHPVPTLSGNTYFQEGGSHDNRSMLYGNVANADGSFTTYGYASSQENWATSVASFDTNAKHIRWVVQRELREEKAGSFAEFGGDFNEVTINGSDISEYKIVNNTADASLNYSVRNAIYEASGASLAVVNEATSDKVIKITTDSGVAANTVKVFVEGNTLYIAAHSDVFMSKAVDFFEELLAGGEYTFADGYEESDTLDPVSYDTVSGTLKLIGDADKNPVSYSVGDTAKVNVAAYADGNILSVPYFHVTTYNESTGASTDKYVSGASGVCELNLTSSTEGFVYWTVVACDSNKNKISTFSEVDSNIHYAGSVGFNVNSIAKSSSKPADFDSNWAAAAAEVAGIALDLNNIAADNDPTGSKIEMAPVSAKTGYEAYRVEIPYANAGGFVTGYLTYPTNATAGSLGLMLRFQSNSVSAPDKNYDANAAVFTVCAHSLDLTQTGNSTYMSNFKSSINKGGNNFAWDNESFSTSYLVKMVKRDLLAGKFMIEYFTANGLWNGTDFTAKGTSMGGFQSIAVAALLDDVVTGKKITTLDVSLPWLCDLGAETNNRKDSSWRPTYAYADNVHFATMLGDVDEIIVNAGLGDAICPASGVMAFYNTIDNDNKSITFRQNNTHSGGYDGAYYTIEN